VCHDEGIIQCKGPPIFNQEERIKLVESCRWIQRIQPDLEYDMNPGIIAKYGCDYWIHGEDPTFNHDGENLIDQMLAKGKLKLIKRTTGVSTTGITGKLLAILNADNESQSVPSEPPKQKFLQTVSRIRNFSARHRDPLPGEKIGYYQGSFDLYHPGVVERLKRAKEQCDYLYVGLWSDEMIHYYRGQQYPLMSMQERLLMLLACKHVDDVVVECPYIIT